MNPTQYTNWRNNGDGTISPDEIWKEIKDYEGLYEVSTFGNVRRSCASNGTKGGLLKPGIRNGYWGVGLSKNNKSISRSIHRLVAETFIPNPENKRTVNHIDAVKTNNHISNLEWATHQENSIHAHVVGVSISIPPIKKGDRHSEEAKNKMSDKRTKYWENFKSGRAKILLHIETGIFYSVKEAASYLGTDYEKIKNMTRYESTLLHHKFLLT